MSGLRTQVRNPTWRNTSKLWWLQSKFEADKRKENNQYTYPKIKNHKFLLLWQCTWKNSLEGYFHIVVHVKQVQNINVGKASRVCLKEEVEKRERWYSEIFGNNNQNTVFIFSWMKFRKAFLGCYNQRCKASENE